MAHDPLHYGVLSSDESVCFLCIEYHFSTGMSNIWGNHKTDNRKPQDCMGAGTAPIQSCDFSGSLGEAINETDLYGFSTGHFDYLSGNHSCLLTCQKQDRFGNIFRLD